MQRLLSSAALKFTTASAKAAMMATDAVDVD